MAGIVYEGVRNTTGDGGKLFEGLSFWFSSAVPQRKWLLDNAIANGATIVPLEKQADVLIVDHARKNAPVGTHSYRYIEQSIRNGALEDLADHVVGPSKSTDRPVGSMTTAAKGSRSKYTEAEDQLLWNFIKPYELRGGATGGNEIYKQLEEAHGNGRHTYQSWRDRWLRHVKFQNRQITDNVYTADNEEEVNEVTQQVAQASPRKRVPPIATPPTFSPRRAFAVTNGQASIGSPNLSRTVPASPEDAATFHYRQALQRKLGRVLPSSSTTSDFRDWEQVPVPKKPEDIFRTETFRLRRQQAGLGTHVPPEENVREDQSNQPSQAAVEELDKEGLHDQSSQASGEYFTDDDYNLLMDAAAFMIRAGDDDDESWEKLEEHYPTHSAGSWKEFWKGKVKPDYLKKVKKVVQIKKERASPDARGRAVSGALREINEDNPADQSDEASPGGEGVDDGHGSGSEGEDHRYFAEAIPEDDGLDSLFGTSITVLSPREPSPFTCRWLGCDKNIPSMSSLLEHVSSKHKPGARGVAGDLGYTCRWKDCNNDRVDEHGDRIVLDLRKPEVWANHFIKEHIKTIHLKHGLGPSDSERRMSEQNAQSTTHGIVEAEAKGSSSPESNGLFLSPRPQAPGQDKKTVQSDGSSEDDEEEEEAVNDSSEEAEETEGSSSSEGLAEEIDGLSSNDDEDDEGSNTSPRRSKRLRNGPQLHLREPTVFNYVDTGVGSSPPFPADDAPADDKPTTNVSSTSIRPLSLSPSKPPEPNEARKRSAGKGNSQESNQNSTNMQEVIDQHGDESSHQEPRASQRKRTREVEEEPEITRQKSPDLPVRTSFDPQVKRRKQHPEQEEPVEIPSTPEHRTILGELFQEDDDDRGSSMLGGSPTPRRRARFGSGDDFRSTTPRRAGTQSEEHQFTSPLQISMFSDTDNKFAASSPAKSASTRHDELSSEPDLEFETAPQTGSNLWITAPSEEPDGEDGEEETQYETAREPNEKGRERLDTQSLFAEKIPDIDDEDDPFALAEPIGGWPDEMDDDNDIGGPLTELPIPTSHQPERIDQVDDDEDDDDDAASIADVPGWLDEVTEEDDSVDLETLLHALNATSGFNEKLIREVHDFMLARKKYVDSDKLPMHWKGCWTDEDDEALRKGDARERIRILKKHGRSSMERRTTWLEALEQG
jgi:hypothetical protein